MSAQAPGQKSFALMIDIMMECAVAVYLLAVLNREALSDQVRMGRE